MKHEKRKSIFKVVLYKILKKENRKLKFNLILKHTLKKIFKIKENKRNKTTNYK